MNILKQFRTYLLLGSLVFALQSFQGFAQTNSDASKASSQQGKQEHDGQHDFDFNVGTWKTHIKRLQQPLTGSDTWVELNGTVAVRKVWNGRAQLEEIEADGSTGHFEGLTLFLYNPHTHQWSQNFADSDDGSLEQPSIGEFKNGRGEFYDQETYNGKAIMVRSVWSDITPDSHRVEQAFSDDGGKTWEPNFIAMLTREKETPVQTAVQPVGTEPNGQHDFDFALGTWKEHSTRLLHPLTGSATWIDMDGKSIVYKIWNGRASMTELESDGPNGHLELLSLRLFNPQTHQWNLTFAHSDEGVLGMPPTVGEFRNGRGEFYDQELLNGKAIWVRFRIFPITRDTAQSEQAFSNDGGKTWETNWINKYIRLKDESKEINRDHRSPKLQNKTGTP